MGVVSTAPEECFQFNKTVSCLGNMLVAYAVFCSFFFHPWFFSHRVFKSFISLFILPQSLVLVFFCIMHFGVKGFKLCRITISSSCFSKLVWCLGFDMIVLNIYFSVRKLYFFNEIIRTAVSLSSWITVEQTCSAGFTSWLVHTFP